MTKQTIKEYEEELAELHKKYSDKLKEMSALPNDKNSPQEQLKYKLRYKKLNNDAGTIRAAMNVIEKEIENLTPSLYDPHNKEMEKEFFAQFNEIMNDSIIPFVHLTFKKKNDLSIFQSKLGGVPYLPINHPYPQLNGNPLFLLVQINFAEIPLLKTTLKVAYCKYMYLIWKSFY